MSDNFDGKLQDVDPKGDEEDEDEKDEDNNDAEKEMGDTEKEADQLDQQVYFFFSFFLFCNLFVVLSVLIFFKKCSHVSYGYYHMYLNSS